MPICPHFSVITYLCKIDTTTCATIAHHLCKIALRIIRKNNKNGIIMDKINLEGIKQKILRNSPIKWKEIGFVMLPHKILFDEELKSSDLMVYWVLMVHQFNKDNCFPSQSAISKESRLCRRTVITSIQRLEKAGWIKKEKRDGKSCIYRVLIQKVK